MAEGWAKSILGDCVDAFSAGTKPQLLDQLAVRVMKEAGVDISSHASKHLDSLKNHHFDLIVTVCDSAVQSCPLPPEGTRVIHARFDDPPQLAKDAKSEEEALGYYQRVRDEIRAFVSRLSTMLENH